MNMDAIFQFSNLLTIPFWILMILAPNWQWTRRILSSLWVIVPAALLYAILIIPQFGSAMGELMGPTLAGVQGLLGTPAGATVGWVHFLAFDLFVGRWEVLDNKKTGLPFYIMSVALFFTLMLGPVGFLIYLFARAIKTGNWRMVSDS